MKKKHFESLQYQRLTLNQKINCKAYFLKHLPIGVDFDHFEFMCILDVGINC